MRDYAKVVPTFWTGETGKALRRRGPEAVMVAMYLMTAPGSNMLGLYYQPVLYMAHETGLGLEGASKGLRDCVEVGFCHYDEASEMVWVVEMAAYQIARELKASDNRCAGIQRDYDALQDNPFLALFFDHYQAAFHLTKRRASEAPSEPLPSQEQEQEQEQEQKEQEQKPTDAASPTPAPARRTSKCTFETFLAECRAKGEKPIPEDHAVFAFAADTKIPIEYIRLTWLRFKERFGRDGKDATKRQAGARGWRQHFGNAVRENWFKLWWFTPEGEWQLTTPGIATQREADAIAEREAQRKLQAGDTGHEAAA